MQHVADIEPKFAARGALGGGRQRTAVSSIISARASAEDFAHSGTRLQGGGGTGHLADHLVDAIVEIGEGHPGIVEQHAGIFALRPGRGKSSRAIRRYIVRSSLTLRAEVPAARACSSACHPAIRGVAVGDGSRPMGLDHAAVARLRPACWQAVQGRMSEQDSQNPPAEGPAAATAGSQSCPTGRHARPMPGATAREMSPHRSLPFAAAPRISACFNTKVRVLISVRVVTQVSRRMHVTTYASNGRAEGDHATYFLIAQSNAICDVIPTCVCYAYADGLCRLHRQTIIPAMSGDDDDGGLAAARQPRHGWDREPCRGTGGRSPGRGRYDMRSVSAGSWSASTPSAVGYGRRRMGDSGRWAAPLVRRLRRPSRPALLHTHGYKANLLGRLAGLLTRVPTVATYHAGEKPPGMLAWYDRADRWTSFLGGRIAVSRPILARLPFGGWLVPNFVAVPPRPSASAGQPDVVAYVGRMSLEKGPDMFCDLAAAAPGQSMLRSGAAHAACVAARHGGV